MSLVAEGADALYDAALGMTDTGGCGNRFCLQLNGSFPCGKAIGVSRYFLRLAWVLHDSLKVARLNLAATSMGIPMETIIYRCCPDRHFCHDF